MKNNYSALYQTWMFESTDAQGWNTIDYSFIKFTKEGKLEFIDLNGKVIKAHNFRINDKAEIIVSENKVLAKIIELNDQKLILAFVGKQLNNNIQNKYSFIPKVQTKTSFNKKEISDYIAKYNWRTTMFSSGNNSLDIELSPKNIDLELELKMITQKGERKNEMAMPARIVSFDNTYFLEYKIPGMASATERFIIATITEDDFFIKIMTENGEYEKRAMVKF
ncbi:MAG TPA: hypothetical protein ENJ95_17425 [Bacteroidetes bacterium]|nr:hypothetical protein [Bacteroidota bacterium]